MLEHVENLDWVFDEQFEGILFFEQPLAVGSFLVVGVALNQDLDFVSVVAGVAKDFDGCCFEWGVLSLIHT